ncbi:calcium-transporting ATPase 4, plasma membrane-type-like protein, partial [Tanacetum coccineum]
MVVERYLADEFHLPAGKHPSDEALINWRKAVSLVMNKRRRFRHTAKLDKREMNKDTLSKFQ